MRAYRMNKTKTLQDHFTRAVLLALEETFENVRGLYLDPGTTLFETLVAVTAEEASRPLSATCASISAHVEHMRFSIDYVLEHMRQDKAPAADWSEIWRTVRDVTPDEWIDSQRRLRLSYDELRTYVETRQTWAGDVTYVVAILLHNAYHLGEIRQALCAIQPDR
jgi:hypothetical protein